MTQVDYVKVAFHAGESASEAFELAVHSIVAFQPRGLMPYVASITLPDDWSAASLMYEIGAGDEWMLLSDLRGLISAAARPGQVLRSTAELWKDARWIRLRSEPPQRYDVTVTLGIGATKSDSLMARPFMEVTR